MISFPQRARHGTWTHLHEDGVLADRELLGGEVCQRDTDTEDGEWVIGTLFVDVHVFRCSGYTREEINIRGSSFPSLFTQCMLVTARHECVVAVEISQRQEIRVFHEQS